MQEEDDAGKIVESELFEGLECQLHDLLLVHAPYATLAALPGRYLLGR